MGESKAFACFQGKRVGLIGAGVTNMPLAEVLVKAGALVTVHDVATEEQLGERASRLLSMGCHLEVGPSYLDRLDEEVLFRSPGIRPDHPAFQAAKEKGSRITSEMEMFLEKTPAKVFAVTGSDGKSTTTTLISLLLEEEKEQLGQKKNVFLGGNIGEPLLHRIEQMTSEDEVAAEISSFQLMSIHSPVFRAVITNITPNHLNWHIDMEEYIQAKAKLLEGCSCAVLNFGNEITRSIGEKCEMPVVYFSRNEIPLSEIQEKDAAICIHGDEIVYATKASGEWQHILSLKDILLPGLHNAENYMAAIAATWGFVSFENVKKVASSFGGVKHRLQLIRSLQGVSFYNSSIDSTPTRTLAALSAMGERSIVLMVGGYDKHIPFDPLAEGIARRGHVRGIVVSGATASLIQEAFCKSNLFQKANIPVIRTEKFDDAFKEAVKIAMPGDAVLLSPACASFDEFSNFEKRGEHFVDLVNAL